MGNFTLEINTLKNKLAMGEKKKGVLHEELDKKKNSRRAINIMWKCRGRTRLRLNRKVKCSLRNCMMRMRSSRVAQHG